MTRTTAILDINRNKFEFNRHQQLDKLSVMLSETATDKQGTSIHQHPQLAERFQLRCGVNTHNKSPCGRVNITGVAQATPPGQLLRCHMYNKTVITAPQNPTTTKHGTV